MNLNHICNCCKSWLIVLQIISMMKKSAKEATAPPTQCTEGLPDPKIRTTKTLTHKDALCRYIRGYFAKDKEFNRNVEKNLKYVLNRQLRPTKFDLSNMTLREAINIVSEVENSKKRKPMVLHASSLTSLEPDQLVQDLGIDPETKIESFRGAITTPKEMIHSVEERSKIRKKYPVTVVADLPFTSIVKNDLADRIKQHIQWNALIFHTDFEQTSLVLSDTDALATPHIHPNMFWNCSFCGTKTYFLVDADEFAQKIAKKIIKRSELPWKEKSVYKSTISFNGKITFAEFKLLKNAYFTIISSDSPNFIIVPTRYIHEVWTVCGGKDGVYGGLVGGAMPRSIEYQRATEEIRKDRSMESFFGVSNIDDWFTIPDENLDHDLIEIKKSPIKTEPSIANSKKRKNRNGDCTEEDEDLTKLYCVCRGHYNPDLWMIECNACLDWFHGKCIGLEFKESKKVASYYCENCQKSTGKAITYKKKRRRNY
jgi:hypothetical protein